MARQPQYLVERQRTLGRYLAALREAAGLYQSDLARAVPCHRTTVTHTEAGSQLPDSHFWEVADQVTGANGALIASYDDLIHARDDHVAEQRAERRARAQSAAQQIKPNMSEVEDVALLPASASLSTKSEISRTGALGERLGDIKRRELLRLLSMIGPLVATSGADDQDNSGQLDAPAVDEYAMLSAHLWRVFVLSKHKGAVFPLVRDQLEVLAEDLGQLRAPTVHRRLCALMSELLQLAGEIFFDANKYTDAAHCYTLAAVAGKEAGNFDLWACALTRHAFIGIYERHFEKAIPVLALAERLARRGDESLSTKYWVSSVQAHVFAGLGELDACRRALDAAEQINALPNVASNGGWLRFDGSRLAEERGSCYVALRRFDLAENALADALRQNLPARRRGSVLTDLAVIGTQRGDVDQLVSYADAALTKAEQTGSGFIVRKLQLLQGHISSFLEDGRVRQIDQRIMALSDDYGMQYR